MMRSHLKLVPPSMDYKEELATFRRELEAAKDESAFAGCGGLQHYDTVEECLSHIAEAASAETCPAGQVPESDYLAVTIPDKRLVGIISLREHIEHPVLKLIGGHIGYSVRPTERRKGYAKEMLKLALEKYREQDFQRILVTCKEGNIGSERTILANGGVFECSVCVDGRVSKRYWIDL